MHRQTGQERKLVCSLSFCYSFVVIAIIKPHRFSSLIRVPASKSHTIRRLLLASLAEGVSDIEQPLDSLDTRSCLSVCRALGAKISESPGCWSVRGLPRFSGQRTPISCDVGNSGTTLLFALAAAALGNEPVEFIGDEQIRSRSAGPLLDALAGLGVTVKSSPSGSVPITVQGPWKGGRVSLPCPTSQYLSALLLSAPLADAGVVTEIDVPLLNERPYIDMTLSYLDNQGIPYEAAQDFSYFRISGGSSFQPVSGPVPRDFSSAAFPAAAAVISRSSVTLLGLDPEDLQGDKAFFGFLEKMGCQVKWEQVPLKCPSVESIPLGDVFPDELHALGVQTARLCLSEWQLRVSRSHRLTGGEFDLNDTPDLLPALAAIACFASGDTTLVNVASARLKETDRIAAMAEELRKLGVNITERPDGLIIRGTGSKGAALLKKEGNYKLNGRQDHRVVMALACAALACPGPVEIAGAEYAAVTYPGFLEMLKATK